MAGDRGGRSQPGGVAWWPYFVSANGIALVWYEAVFAGFDRPWLLGIAGGMVGVLPAYIIDDLLRRRDKT